MGSFSFKNTDITDLIIVNSFFSEDERGNFIKSFEKDIFKNNGIEMIPYENFESTSKKGVIRGLHFQTENPQAKLIRVPFGEILDIAVDLRKESPTFGKWHSENLSSDNRKTLYIPSGFAHGFITLSDIAIVSYLCDSKYSAATDGGIVWNDKELNINWQLEKVNKVNLSERDKKLQTFSEYCNSILV